MSSILKVSFAVYMMIVFLLGCGADPNGGKDDKNNDGLHKPGPINRVNWSAISSEHHPEVEDTSFSTDSYEKIYVDAFGFNNDVEVIYSNDTPAGHGNLRIFKVWAKNASWGNLNQSPNGKSLNIINYGRYECSIRVQNGQITQLEGGCYVRLQVFLPIGSQIEVYNVGKLITKRFIPITSEEFLKQIDNATRADDKFVVIENYLSSYSGTNKSPSLSAEQLGTVIGEFSWREEQFKALHKLHSLVRDRENLGKMIEDKFSYFDRQEARRIVGLEE